MVATLGLAVLAILAADKGAWKPPFDVEAKATAWLKENVNDLSKFMIVRTSKPFSVHKWRRFTGGGIASYPPGVVAVYVKYRTANAFGAVELQEEVFAFTSDGKLYSHDTADKTYPPDEPSKAERFTDEFLDRYRH